MHERLPGLVSWVQKRLASGYQVEKLEALRLAGCKEVASRPGMDGWAAREQAVSGLLEACQVELVPAWSSDGTPFRPLHTANQTARKCRVLRPGTGWLLWAQPTGLDLARAAHCEHEMLYWAGCWAKTVASTSVACEAYPAVGCRAVEPADEGALSGGTLGAVDTVSVRIVVRRRFFLLVRPDVDSVWGVAVSELG